MPKPVLPRKRPLGIPSKSGNRNYKGSKPQAGAGIRPTAYQAMNGFRTVPAILALPDRTQSACPRRTDKGTHRRSRSQSDEAGLQDCFRQLPIMEGERKDTALAGLFDLCSPPSG